MTKYIGPLSGLPVKLENSLLFISYEEFELQLQLENTHIHEYYPEVMALVTFMG